MRTLAIAALVGGLLGGCATADRARAQYHQDRADRAAAHGHYGEAARQQHKAEIDEWKAEHAPLP